MCILRKRSISPNHAFPSFIVGNVAKMARAPTAFFIIMLLAPFSGVWAGAADKNIAASNANPIRRVVNLLQKMAKKVAAEGVKEKELYDKFMCYCQTGNGELAQSIADSTAKVPQVQSDIESAEASLAKLKEDLKAHQEDRAAAKSAMAAATSQRESENKEFLKTSGEYKQYLSALGGAIPAIEKGMSGSFLQSTSQMRQLEQAVSSAASITDYDRRLLVSFITSSNMDGYVPKSGEVIGILKQIQADFQKSLAEVESAEASSVKLHEELMAAKTKQVEMLTSQIEKKTARIGDLQVEIVSMKNDLTDTEAALIADQKFKTELTTSCETKTGEWEERQKTRAEELIAIHETIKILNDDDALELFKKTLPSPSLLQLKASKEHLKHRALGIIRKAQHSATGRPGLDFLAFALSGQKVDFSKVIKMIDDMVALLKMEQVDDDSKQEYCAKSIDTAEDKVKALASKVEDLETSIEAKAEQITTLTGEIKTLTKQISDLDKSVTEATEQRKKEHEEYVELMSSNSAAKELLAYAKNRLHKFYTPTLYKAPPKRELTEEEGIFTNYGGTLAPTEAPGGIAGTGISAIEEPAVLVQVAKHSQENIAAPPPPPATWSAYSKKSEEGTGVIAMIDLLIKDLDKEMTEAETQEKDEQKDYEALMTDAGKKRAADLKSIAQKENAKADAEEGKAADDTAATSTGKELQATKRYEMELHQECDWLMQNFDVRKQARAEEMDSLKQAKAVLAGADFSLLQGAATGSKLRGR